MLDARRVLENLEVLPFRIKKSSDNLSQWSSFHKEDGGAQLDAQLHPSITQERGRWLANSILQSLGTRVKRMGSVRRSIYKKQGRRIGSYIRLSMKRERARQMRSSTALCARRRAIVPRAIDAQNRREQGCEQVENKAETRRPPRVRRAALNAHEATQRKTRKYAKGPIQVGVVSRLARASAQDRLRANEDFRPRLRGALSRSRRDLAIRAVAALNAHGAAHRRTRKYAKGPIQVSVVLRFARVWARLRVRAKRRSLGDIEAHLPLLAEI